jgi:hypothetical protein
MINIQVLLIVRALIILKYFGDFDFEYYIYIYTHTQVSNLFLPLDFFIFLATYVI